MPLIIIKYSSFIDICIILNNKLLFQQNLYSFLIIYFKQALINFHKTSLLRKVIKISKISSKNTINLNEHLRKYDIMFTEIFCCKLGECI